MLGEGARTDADAERYEARLRRRHRGRGQARRTAQGRRRATASRSSSRRCRPATRRRRRRGSGPSSIRACKRLAVIAATPRHQLHPRRRGGRPAGPVAEAARPAGARARRWATGAGLGLAVQAYQKRAPAGDRARWPALAADSGRRLMVRLVKGAYWDTEIKRAQVAGRPDYPVYTTKPATDLSLPRLRPGADRRRARTSTPSSPPTTPIPWPPCARMAASAGVTIEYQRLHGMGEALYAGGRRPLRRVAAARLCAGGRARGPAALSGAPPAGERRQHLLRPRPAGRARAGGEGGAATRSPRWRRQPGRASAHPAAAPTSTARPA